MKGLFFIVGVALWVGATADRLDSKTVRDLIDRVQELNGIKRQMNAKKDLGAASGCPLARYHNKKALETKSADSHIAHDLLAARKILLDAGYLEEELEAKEIGEEFLRQAGSECFDPTCVPSPYRTADGSCNNEANPRWGSTGMPQGRLLEAEYFTGTTYPRNTSVGGSALPNPRDISNEVHAGEVGAGPIRSDTINLHTFQMGQFLDHDITLTPTQTSVSDCCTNIDDKDNCFPIVFPKSRDEVGFFRLGRNEDQQNYCMNVQRSEPHGCAAANGDREQINGITSFIDCSNVYGSTDEEQAALRDGAFIKMDNTYWLPKEDSGTACELNGQQGPCVLAGDHRAPTVPSLTSYHILFAMEHNRIVNELRAEYPNDEEKLFQEARRILIAVMQKIVYDEFLPSFLSENAMSEYDLQSDADYQYDPSIDATILNEFAIAYRFGHTWIPRTMERFDSNFRPIPPGNGARVPTRASFEDMTLTYFGFPSTQNPRGIGPTQLAYWLTGEQSAETDNIIEEDARSFLFQDPDARSAFDLVALNIQRGRDHGLPSYTKYREKCGFGTVTRFSDLSDHTEDLQNRLAAVYENPNDIDLFTGALTEAGAETGSLGRTLECILGKQFRNLKFGDRFWYQAPDAGFRQDQINAIQDYSMAGVLCNNFDYPNVDPNAFVRSRKVSCNEVNRLNLNAFKTPTTTTSTTTTTTARPARPPPPPGPGPGGRPPQNGGRPRSQRINDILVAKELDTVEELLEILGEE